MEPSRKASQGRSSPNPGAPPVTWRDAAMSSSACVRAIALDADELHDPEWTKARRRANLARHRLRLWVGEGVSVHQVEATPN